MEIEKRQECAADNISDNIVKLVKGGTIEGDNKALGDNWPSSDVYSSYGSNSDLWGLSWDVADINAIDFGIVISVNHACFGWGHIDHIRITVYVEDSVAITNQDFVDVEQSGDTDDLYSISGQNITVGSGYEFHLFADQSYIPGGTLATAGTEGNFHLDDGATANFEANTATITGDVTIDNNATLIAPSSTLSVGGNWSNSATGVFTHSSGTVTFDDTAGSKTISDGGDAFHNIIFNGSGGEWFYQDGASTAPNQTTVQAGTPTYLNTKTGTVSVTGGILIVDWYLATHLVNAANTATNIDTADAEITISENSGTPQSTIFRHNGSIWGTGATSQTTGTLATGINPQPNSDGAIRIREYAMTASATCPGAGCSLYNYNLQVDWLSAYGQYNYYDDYGDKYLTSTLNTSSGQDETISSSWYRTVASSINGTKEYDGVNNPPTQGTWYACMLTGLDVNITGTAITFGSLNFGNNFTDTASTQTQITVSTSATNGYVVTAWETQKMTHEAYAGVTIDNFNVNSGADYGDYVDPLPWTNNCSTASPNNECGFGFTSNDTSVEGSNRYNNGTEYAGFSESSASPIRVIDYADPADAVSNLITYRISASNTQGAGTYATTIVYVITAEY